MITRLETLETHHAPQKRHWIPAKKTFLAIPKKTSNCLSTDWKSPIFVAPYRTLYEGATLPDYYPTTTILRPFYLSSQKTGGFKVKKTNSY
ncbi:hypothetical protein [Pedobacter gandavensis]|uniref:Uncharacterized protein n=1 Tax=Pedobacter gandavensis TaxID=2679963 RepID=A0ABR6EXN8_9SPHI|nr:hypothetical protein [Pedobacter gandavensis]MBB2150050.1 hypothetical protein [Pedobacter gandavensis]